MVKVAINLVVDQREKRDLNNQHADQHQLLVKKEEKENLGAKSLGDVRVKGKKMKKFFLKIIKEDAQKPDSTELKKQEMSKIILAGDSIAVGVGIWGLKQKGARCCGVTTFDNIVPIFPAVRGAQATKWIKTQLINQLNSGKSFAGHKLIIIAGTNDSLGYGLSPSNKTITDAINNIKDMVDTAISKGIKKEDIAIMKIAKYEPSESRLKAYIKDRQRRGWYPKNKTGEEYKKIQAYFVEKFNAGISSYNTFDMVPVNPDGVHTGSNGSKKLLNRALGVLGVKNVNNVEIPTSTLPSAPTIAINNKLTSKDCHVNNYCNCVDRLVSSEITIVSVQRALKTLGFSIQETGACDKQTRDVIMQFQKQQQKKQFIPIHGKDKELGFLRCDACVGINTMAAINKELASTGNKKTIQAMLTPGELVKAKKARIRIVSYSKGKVEDLENYDEKPLKGEIIEVTNSHIFPDGKKEYTISYNFSRGRQKQVAQYFLDNLKKVGITNPYVVMGILGCTGKESGFRLVFEGAGYRFNTIKAKKGAVAKRVWRRFKDHGFGEPQDKHIRAITGGGRNGIALFNIAYGYSSNQKDERLTASRYPVLVNGEINPELYNENLAGWKYRGTGPIQCTFKASHMESAAALGMRYSDIRQKLLNPSTRMETAILMSCGYMKATFPWALKKYGKEPSNIKEGLEWAQNCVGGIGLGSPAKPGNALHKGFLNAIPWIKNNFRLKIEEDPENV